MSNTLLLKRSSTPNSIPSSGSLEFGELALNYADGNLFYKNAANTVTVIASNQFVSVLGNITGNNISATTAISATGNVTGGNVLSLGTISSTGTVTANTVTYTNIAGTNGQVLTTYGNGVTYFSTPASAGGSIYVYGRSGTIIVPISNGFLVIGGRTGNIEVAVQP